MTTSAGRMIRALVESLEQAARHIEEMGCTCTPDQRQARASTHARDCTGENTARRYRALCTRIRRRTSTQEPRKATRA